MVFCRSWEFWDGRTFAKSLVPSSCWSLVYTPVFGTHVWHPKEEIFYSWLTEGIISQKYWPTLWTLDLCFFIIDHNICPRHPELVSIASVLVWFPGHIISFMQMHSSKMADYTTPLPCDFHQLMLRVAVNTCQHDLTHLNPMPWSLRTGTLNTYSGANLLSNLASARVKTGQGNPRHFSWQKDEQPSMLTFIHCSVGDAHGAMEDCQAACDIHKYVWPSSLS